MFTFNVPKLSCAGCVNTIKNAILKIDVNAIVEADLSTKTVDIQTNSAEEGIIQAMTDVGYRPS